jgi:hypothetical protein
VEEEELPDDLSLFTTQRSNINYQFTPCT